MSEVLNAPFIIAILIALTVHEWAHAFVADRLGDPTPREQGRLTLNPIAHLDLVGTIMFFLVHFGWGKPVPIDPRYFKRYKRDTALVAIAGPLSNLLLAFLAFFLLLWLTPDVHLGSVNDLLTSSIFGERLQAFAIQVLMNALFLNLGLMAFNLLPIAPLDGSKIIHPFIPLRFELQYERFLERGPIILIGLLILERMFNVPILLTWISWIMDTVLNAMQALV
jgi:Zn-dependent protease